MTPEPCIVALGASNTAGYGVAADEAYPAVLQRLLAARGLAIDVSNAGVSGQTTGEMLARLHDAVPATTRIVIFQPGSNDARRGLPEAVRDTNIATITAHLEGRGIHVLRLGAIYAAVQPRHVQADGIHFTPRGHERVAELLVDDVIALLGKPITTTNSALR